MDEHTPEHRSIRIGRARFWVQLNGQRSQTESVRWSLDPPLIRVPGRPFDVVIPPLATIVDKTGRRWPATCWSRYKLAPGVYSWMMSIERAITEGKGMG